MEYFYRSIVYYVVEYRFASWYKILNYFILFIFNDTGWSFFFFDSFRLTLCNFYFSGVLKISLFIVSFGNM